MYIMQSRKLKKLITALSVVFVLSSCTSKYIVPDPPAAPPAPPSPNENKISFEKEIEPVFVAKCVKCHGVGQVPPVLAEDKAYPALMSSPGMIDTITPGNSILYIEMAAGGGMSMYCNRSNADSVYKWIRQGAKDN
jgi:mono/diheme cytochrome c family protein